MSDSRRPSVLIRGVRLYGEGDPVDVLVDDGQIADIGADLAVPDDADVVDAGGQDPAARLRRPAHPPARAGPRVRRGHRNRFGGSGSRRIHRGVRDGQHRSRSPTAPVVTDHVWHRGQQVGLVDVHPVGAVTVGLKGTQLTEMGLMAAGVGQVRMFSDDGICVDDPLVMRRALEYATGLGVLIAQHAEEPRLTVGAVAHEGPNAARLGLAGWPRAAEESIVARDALLARDAGARVHICHASTAGTVELVRWAKEQGISITAEVTPHHLLLDDARLADLRRPQPGQPAAAGGQRRGGAAPGAGRRRHRLRRHRSRAARRAREDVRVRRRPARHARTADRAVGGRRDDGAARAC